MSGRWDLYAEQGECRYCGKHDDGVVWRRAHRAGVAAAAGVHGLAGRRRLSRLQARRATPTGTEHHRCRVNVCTPSSSWQNGRQEPCTPCVEHDVETPETSCGKVVVP